MQSTATAPVIDTEREDADEFAELETPADDLDAAVWIWLQEQQPRATVTANRKEPRQ